MGAFSLEQFRTEVLSGAGLARTNRFEVDITPPPALAGRYGAQSNLTSLYIEQSNIPLLNIFTKAFKIFGPSYQRPVTSEYGGESMPMTFHVDRYMNVRKFFEDWMHTIVDPNRFTLGYQEDYATTITIKQLNEDREDGDNVVYGVELLEAFPRNINLMDLNNASSNQTHRLNVNFAYRYWRRLESTSPQPIPRSVVNPQIPTSDMTMPEEWFWRSTNSSYPDEPIPGP